MYATNWPEAKTHAFVESEASGTFNLSEVANGGNVFLDVIVDCKAPVTVTFSKAQFLDFSKAEASQVASVVNDVLVLKGASATAEGGHVKITSNQEGRESRIQVLPKTPNANAVLQFPLGSSLGSGPPEPLLYPPGLTAGFTPKVLLNTVRMPLASFAAQAGFNPCKVSHVDFVFDRIGTGSVFFSDIGFVDSAAQPLPCP